MNRCGGVVDEPRLGLAAVLIHFCGGGHWLGGNGRWLFHRRGFPPAREWRRAWIPAFAGM